MSAFDAIAADRPAWMTQAACRGADPNLFYPNGRGAEANHAYRKARAVCDRCPVAADCLGYALAHDIGFGIWAGTSPLQRRTLRRTT